MPRQGRIDAPGAIHHIIIRGIERRKIFCDDADGVNFLDRLGGILVDTQTQCFAWALLPNHAHMLVRTGRVPLATVMHKLLTGYAVSFNRKHRRHGQLFQNRYKSILCQEDVYLKEFGQVPLVWSQRDHGKDKERLAGYELYIGPFR